MPSKSDPITALIEKVILRDVELTLRHREPDLEYTLRIDPPVAVESLPTFDRRKRRPLSPMLRARFEFASSITLGFSIWPGAEEMAAAMAKARVREYHLVLREHSERSGPQLFPDDALSLFSYDPESPEDRVYLVWKDPAREPEVWEYHDMDTTEFKTLETFLRWRLR
jgi:hypothetical protein